MGVQASKDPETWKGRQVACRYSPGLRLSLRRSQETCSVYSHPRIRGESNGTQVAFLAGRLGWRVKEHGWSLLRGIGPMKAMLGLLAPQWHLSERPDRPLPRHILLRENAVSELSIREGVQQ